MEGEMEKINNLYTYSKVGKNNTIDPVFYAMNFESQNVKGLSQGHTATKLHNS